MDHEIKSRGSSTPLEGRYANYFKIGHNAFEFILDCGQCYAESDEPKLHTRIITVPAYAKALLETLKDAVDQHEHERGVIRNE